MSQFLMNAPYDHATAVPCGAIMVFYLERIRLSQVYYYLGNIVLQTVNQPLLPAS
jgi:hypothetical protein